MAYIRTMSQVTWHQIGKQIVNNGFEITWREAVAGHFNVLSHHLPRGRETRKPISSS